MVCVSACVCNSANDTWFEGDMEINKGLIFKFKSAKKIQNNNRQHNTDMKCDSHVDKETKITIFPEYKRIYSSKKLSPGRLRGTTAALTTTWR